MFGLTRKNRSPLSTARQVDIDLLLRRNVEVLGLSFVRAATVITDITPWNLKSLVGLERVKAAAEKVLQQFPSSVTECELSIRAVKDLKYPSTYAPPIEGSQAHITLSDDTVEDPLRTVIEIAYQYSAHFWQQMTDGRELDTNPRTTNLTPICCGLGVLASDACLYDENWSQAGWSGWSISRSGYYNAQEIGYALALFNRSRNESEPDWVSSLRLDSKVPYQKAQRYFAAQQSNGYRLLYDSDKIPSTRCDPRELADWLCGDDPVVAYASGLALIQLSDLPASVATAAIETTQRGDDELAPLATRVLGRLRVLSPEVERCLERLMVRGQPSRQLAAFQSAHELGLSISRFQPQLSKLLDQPAIDPLPTIELIGQQGHELSAMAPKVGQMLGMAIRHQEDLWAKQLIACLLRLVDNPRTVIEQAIRPPKLKQKALKLLKEANEVIEPDPTV